MNKKIEQGTVTVLTDGYELILFLENANLSAFNIKRHSYDKHTIKEFNIPSMVGGIPVTSIYPNAFNIESLQYVTIPDSITTINDRAFNGCINLKEVTIPGSIKEIGFCFQSCDSLSIVKFEEGVEKIDSGAFRFCESIKQIYFPKSVNFIHHEAFSESKNINLIITNGNIEAIKFAKRKKIAYI